MCLLLLSTVLAGSHVAAQDDTTLFVPPVCRQVCDKPNLWYDVSVGTDKFINDQAKTSTAAEWAVHLLKLVGVHARVAVGEGEQAAATAVAAGVSSEAALAVLCCEQGLSAA